MPMPGFANYVREYSDPWAVYQSATPGDAEMNVYLGPSKGNDIMKASRKQEGKMLLAIIVCEKKREESWAAKMKEWREILSLLLILISCFILLKILFLCYYFIFIFALLTNYFNA